MSFVNLTPHAIVIALQSGRVTVPPSGTVARVAQVQHESVEVPGLPCPVVPSPTFGEVEGLPAPQPGVTHLVSALVLARCAGRSDCFAPATGPNDGVVRNDKGQVEAVTRLVAAPAVSLRDELRALAESLEEALTWMSHDFPYAHDNGVAAKLRKLADSV